MRRVVCTKIGSLDHLEVQERPNFDPRPGQIVIDVQAAGITAVDGLIVLGQYPLEVPAPYIPGHEIAGTVRSLGEGVGGFAVGDRVLALMGMGGFASQVAMQAFMVLKVPETLSTPQAGSLLQAYSTALITLTRRLDVKDGERVLVLGAGGGVGLAMVDVARALGAKVIAAASTKEKRALAIGNGASAELDYEHEDLTARAKALARELGGGLDVVVDLVGGRHGPAALAALTSGGRYGALGLSSGLDAVLASSQILRRNRTVMGIDCGDFSINNSMDYMQVMLETLTWASDGKIAPHEPTTRPLEEVGATLTDLFERRIAGKVVMVP